MRKGFIWFIVFLLLALLALAVGPPLFAIVFGGGFDPQMAGSKGESNKGDRSSSYTRYGETDWFRKNRKKRRRRRQIAKDSRKRNR